MHKWRERWGTAEYFYLWSNWNIQSFSGQNWSALGVKQTNKQTKQNLRCSFCFSRSKLGVVCLWVLFHLNLHKWGGTGRIIWNKPDFGQFLVEKQMNELMFCISKFSYYLTLGLSSAYTSFLKFSLWILYCLQPTSTIICLAVSQRQQQPHPWWDARMRKQQRKSKHAKKVLVPFLMHAFCKQVTSIYKQGKKPYKILSRS